jgi:GNAT superfamily N-acetyltransferase
MLMSMYNPMPVEIAFLADYPQYLPTVSGWVYQFWGRRHPGNTLEGTTARFKGFMQRQAIPLTLIALAQDRRPLGTASLFVQDMAIRPQLTPWLASVYTAPEYRQQGVGSQLVTGAEAVAWQLGVACLYLYTPDQEHFYTRLGWQVLERLEYRQEQVVVMTHLLSSLSLPSSSVS